ncbi:MAG: type II and III secretion system protein family protein [Candidatus Pseudomonas phytovorans]|uniref:Type II and III secretion system protein family protein n=1 Tax=Candidatus Pseudomonas phytovorans TaxID=3121377 RepID=A0AAJ5WE68_9PSED|nr:type II and III secretion system protein family protein [Pseudomonas sp.]WEK29037.1 MAG: type II and III secretion system protein family protein [Pseudomonas sp.]
MKFPRSPLSLALCCALGLFCALPAQAEVVVLDPPLVLPEQYPEAEQPADAQAYASEADYPAEPEAQAAPRLPAQLTEVNATRDVHLLVKQGRLLQLPKAANRVLVADPKIASFQAPTPGSVFVFAQAAGTTTLYAMDDQENVIAAIRVVADYDLEALHKQVVAEVPGAQVQFSPSSANGLVVRGSVRTPQQARQVITAVEGYLGSPANGARGGGGGGGGGGGNGGGSGGSDEGPRVINQLKVELSAQVNLSVRIVEVSRSLSSQLGLNWDATLKDGNYFFRNGASLFDATTGAFSGGAVTNAVAGGFHRNGSTTVAGLLTALSQDGLATVLAEPNLTAMSGETAGFAAGGEVPIVIVTNNNITIEYKQYGVIMRMTPTLLSPNRISLHVAPEVSDLSDEGAVELQGNVIPAFKVRRADTTVELASGQSFALAGMLRSNSAQQVTGVPGLRDIPGVGRLFETHSSSQQDTELVIIATAYVVEPTNPGELQSPGRGIAQLDAQTPAQATAGYLF